MSQPLFGSLTDNLRGRWVGATGLLWTLLLYTLASFMPTYSLFIGVLMVGGLGSGAFHAAGLLNASSSGGKKPTLATSVFFVGGQVGYALGPIIAGVLLLRMGLGAMPWIALAMLPAVFVMFFYMNDPLPAPAPAVARGSAAAGAAGRRGKAHTAAAFSGAVAMTALFALITFRSGTAQSFSTLLPKMSLNARESRRPSMASCWASWPYRARWAPFWAASWVIATTGARCLPSSCS